MNAPDTLTPESTALVLIDFQERLFPVMHDRERLLRSVLKLVRGSAVFGLPVIVTEQYPRGLGPTLPEIAALLPGVTPIAKTCFSACDEAGFMAALDASGRSRLLLAGIETHICVCQTAVTLAATGRQVHVVTDGCSSRDPANEVAAYARMQAAGVSLTNVEMALFELLKVGQGELFKRIRDIVK